MEAANAVLEDVVPRGVGDRDVVELEPAVVARRVDVRPVVAGCRLAFVDEYRMQPIQVLNKVTKPLLYMKRYNDHLYSNM